jgi:hypothetical protein
MIKTFNEFTHQHNDICINEGIFDKLNGKQQLANLESSVIKMCIKTTNFYITEYPNKFSNGNDILKQIKPFAERKYKENVTAKFATSFDKWWKEFTNHCEPLVDELIKEIKYIKKDDEDVVEYYDYEKDDEDDDEYYDYEKGL